MPGTLTDDNEAGGPLGRRVQERIQTSKMCKLFREGSLYDARQRSAITARNRDISPDVSGIFRANSEIVPKSTIASII